jgi:energy-coupling factor transporter ATP-binding protein EcfA2
MTESILAHAIVEIIVEAFRHNEEAAHKCFRIKNLQSEEVVALANIWKGTAQGLGLGGVRMVVADDLGGQVPPEYVAEEGLSITYYRNHNQGGLVYVETRVQSDEQGLQNLFTIRDSNFLDGSFDEYAGAGMKVPGLLLAKAWGAVGNGGLPLPALLLERASLVLALVHPEVAAVPVRRFIVFCTAVCARWMAWGSPVDSACADRIVGECLWHLDMFPDEQWREGDVDARVKRRLERNARHADLMLSGVEIDPEELCRAVLRTRFLEPSGAPVSADNQKYFAQLCTEYARLPTDLCRSKIPYSIFEQLFKRDTVGLKLGERVRSDIEQARPDRLNEFDAADLMGGLNAQSQADAERLLELGGAAGEVRLADLLSTRTRRAVERVATPPKRRFFNPAIEVVRLYQRVKSQESGARPARIELRPAMPLDPSNAALGLFAFLFGPTLLCIADALNGVPGACELRLAPELTCQHPVPPLERERDDDEERELIKWLPLGICIRVVGAGGELLEELVQMDWDPAPISHFALMWLLIADPESPVWSAIGELELDDTGSSGDWTLPFVQRLLPLSAIAHPTTTFAAGTGPDAVIGDLLELRRSLRDGLCAEGLSIETINSFLDAWKTILERSRLDYIPDGSRPDALQALLCNDTIMFRESGRRLMLPTQPLRLRWMAGYLEKCAKLASACLEGRAGFATGDGEMYLDWLEELTPHELPPTTSGAAGEILFARSELGWFEDFAPLTRVTSDASVDPHALISIAARVIAYLDAHPHKCDGLSLLLVLPTSDDLPAELIRQVARGRLSHVRVSLTVAAPKARWEQVSKTLAALPGEEQGAASGRLFPARDLAFLEYSAGDDLAGLVDGKLFDIALVTHVLQENVQSQQNTEPPVERTGAFNPVVDRPIRLESSGGGAISIVMLPRDQDFMLETWGTLVVRSNRSRPISPSQPENTDFVELQVSFQDAARVFHALHQCSHWVITLERHISRQQIESIEAGEPDVLSVESDIGGNGLNTLIVSSRSGRALIEHRLARKLRKLVPKDSHARFADGIVEGLARRVYDETRQLSPHLALQAMGVARVTEEILGLCVARRIAGQQFPVRVTDGLSAWISLDEHADWLGGKSQIRADMFRITFERIATGMLEVSVLVLEGKFRQAFDYHGIVQVKQTCEFLKSVLGNPSGDAPESIDAGMWRERLLSAIENVAMEARVVVESEGGTNCAGRNPVPDDIRQMFGEGKYFLKPVQGLYSATLWESPGNTISCETVDGVLVVQSGREHLLELISQTIDESTASETTTTEPKGDVIASPAETAVLDVDVAGVVVDSQSTSSQTGAETTLSAPVFSRRDEEIEGAADGTGRMSGPDAGDRHKMNVAVLRHMYDEILGCFASHNVSVFAASTEDAFIEGPASVLFKVRPGNGVDPKKLFEKTQALKLRLELEQDQNVTFNIDMGFVTIDVPKRLEHRYFVNAADMWRRWIAPAGALSVPIGEDTSGQLVCINFSSPNSPHLLVAGTTGSGKSEALNTILFGLVQNFAPSQLRLLLVDPKGTELLAFDQSAYLLRDIGWDDTDALDLLKQAVAEMQRRYMLFRERKTKSLVDFNSTASAQEKLPWWLVVLDEYADLTHDPQAKKDIEQELKRLAQKARAAGIHVIIATQKPSADVISTNLRSNLPAQLSLRVKSGTESRVVLDEAGAENLNGKGDALLKSDGRLTRVQCARVEPVDQVLQRTD